MMELTQHQNSKMKELITGSSDLIKMLNGEAGSGKSIVLVELERLLTDMGLRVLVVTPTHKTVHNLKDIGLTNVRTIHSFTFSKKSTDVLLVDEVYAIDRELIKKAGNQTKRMVLFGDDRQLKPINALAITDKSIKKVTLTEQMRQRNTTSTMYQYILAKRSGNDYGGANDGSIEIVMNQEELVLKFQKSTSKDKVIIAYKRQTVDYYNLLLTLGEYKIGDTLIAQQTSNGIVNGLDYQVTKVSNTTLELDGNIIVPKDVDYVRHYFAMTIHKSQGSTFDEVYIDLSDIEKSDEFIELMYVASSRAKSKLVLIGENDNNSHL